MNAMSERVRLTAAEIEALCVDGLNKLPGLQSIQYAKIRPYKGDMSWTWELEADPSSGPMALAGAEAVINKLQNEFDLKSNDENHEVIKAHEDVQARPFTIEDDRQADAYLKDFLAKPENRSMEAVEQEARELIQNPDLRMYFIDVARDELERE
jgi:hypothetical protein